MQWGVYYAQSHDPTLEVLPPVSGADVPTPTPLEGPYSPAKPADLPEKERPTTPSAELERTSSSRRYPVRIRKPPQRLGLLAERIDSGNGKDC